jgi:hypothetical protein
MAQFHHLYQGGLRTPTPELYPQNLGNGQVAPCAPACFTCVDSTLPPNLNGEDIGASAHKVDVAFGISRTLDFYPSIVDASFIQVPGSCCIEPNQNNGRMQVGFQQYLRCHNIAQGDTIGMSIIPARTLLHGVGWWVENSESGVMFDVYEVRSGYKLGSIDASSTGSGWFSVAGINAVTSETPDVPQAEAWFSHNGLIALVPTTWPSTCIANLRITISPVIFDPFTGN